VQRHDSTSNLPKAHHLNQRTMEIFRQHAVADPVYAAGTPIEHAEWVTWPTTLDGDGPLDAKILYKMDCFGGGQLKDVCSKDSACPHCGTPVALIDSQSVARTLRELEASPAAPAPSVTPTALDDAQIDALFDLSRMREQDRQHDVLAVGVAALASVIGGWLASR